jgi:putative (di)nucleoside polyphosphate hydrolase
MTEQSKLPYRPCVGVMLVNADGHVLVGQRIDSPGKAWQMPQGGVEPGENPNEAAFRELWEETGVVADLVTVEAETDGWLTYDLPADLVPRLWGGQYRGQKQRWYLMRFQGRDDQIDITLPPREFSHWRWLSPGDLVANIVPFKRDVYTAVLKAFAAHL